MRRFRKRLPDWSRVATLGGLVIFFIFGAQHIEHWTPPAMGVEGACPHGPLTGRVTYVRDGDTIELGRTAIRLQGLAAPEQGDPDGPAASAAMKRLVLGREVRCELDGTRTHDRCAAVCYVDGLDISEVMIRGGYARDCARFSGGRYAQAERQAAAEGATIGQTYMLPGYCRPR